MILPTVARRRLAVALSVAGHPFTLIPCTVALIARPAWLGVAIALTAVATMFAVIAWRVAKGQWSNFDVSDPGQRRGFYAVAIAILATSTVVGWWLGLPPSAIRGFVVALGSAGDRRRAGARTHVSLHMLFGAFCAVLVAGVNLRSCSRIRRRGRGDSMVQDCAAQAHGRAGATWRGGGRPCGLHPACPGCAGSLRPRLAHCTAPATVRAGASAHHACHTPIVPTPAALAKSASALLESVAQKPRSRSRPSLRR